MIQHLTLDSFTFQAIKMLSEILNSSLTAEQKYLVHLERSLYCVHMESFEQVIEQSEIKQITNSFCHIYILGKE